MYQMWDVQFVDIEKIDCGYLDANLDSLGSYRINNSTIRG